MHPRERGPLVGETGVLDSCHRDSLTSNPTTQRVATHRMGFQCCLPAAEARCRHRDTAMFSVGNAFFALFFATLRRLTMGPKQLLQ